MTLQIHSIRTKVKTPLAKRIAHALTDRKILQFRFDAHLRNQVWQRLSKTQKALLNRINAAGIDALPKRELDKLLKELKAEIAKNYQETTAYIQPELSGFFAVEKQALTELYNDEIGYDFFNQVPSYQRKATQQATIIAGMPLESWFEKQGSELSFKFESTIRQGLLEGRQTPEIAKATAELFGISRRHADTLVITAVAKVADDAHKALRDENLDLIKGEMHLSTLDTRTSTVCQVRDGKMWDTDYKPIGHSLPYQRPPLHPRCRSILQLVMKDWKELGFDDVKEMPKSTRASADGQVSEKTNYEEWLNSKSPEEQDAALGKGKADLWRRGVITFADMLDQSGRPLTLKQLREGFNGNKWKEYFSSLDDEPVYSEEAQKLFAVMEERKVTHRPVQKLTKQLTPQEIIDKIAGGDETEGSCASLALAYVGNKCGLDVTDYRGGISREVFSWEAKKVLTFPGIDGKQFVVGRAESREVAEVLKANLVVGKEYYLSAGRHAAIVRKTDSDFEYLELQSATSNGWKSLTKNGRGRIANVLHERFKTSKLSKYRHYAYLAEVDSFKGSKDFEKILGYLNTAEDKQVKGRLGSEK
ncbi:phage minor head protein [Mannheimia haemolytica]|uniref:phage minor head protein n=1 Tax=Mannheimia haemolytica TaxID=75985 RepID=UPI003AFB07CC